MADEEKQSKFCFQHVPAKKFLAFESSDIKDSLMKWGMINRTVVQMFTYDKYFQLYQKDKFIQDFFDDPNVISTLQIFSSSNTPGPLGLKANKTQAEHIPCTITSMDFFDRLYEKGVVRENGNIKKCFDEDYEEFLISDELRKTLLLEESDFYSIFTEEDRKELLFLIFKHICLGGQICQYEDAVTPYLNTSKAIYKELVSDFGYKMNLNKRAGYEISKCALIGKFTAQLEWMKKETYFILHRNLTSNHFHICVLILPKDMCTSGIIRGNRNDTSPDYLCLKHGRSKHFKLCCLLDFCNKRKSFRFLFQSFCRKINK